MTGALCIARCATDSFRSNKLKYGGWTQYTDDTGNPYGRGRVLQDGDIINIVTTMLGTNALPTDPNAMYFVISAADVYYSGFCTESCGW